MSVLSGSETEADDVRFLDAEDVLCFLDDELARIDPSGVLRMWGDAFATSPSPPPPAKSISTLSEEGYAGSVLAAVADYCGLRTRRNHFQNAELVRFSPEDARAAAAHALERGELCAEMVGEVRSAMESADLVDRVNGVVWRWRHAAGIAGSVRGPSGPGWTRRIHRHGFVTIECPRVSDCYEVLGALHCAFEHKPTEIADRLRTPSLSGDASLRTRLVPEGDLGERISAIPIRIVSPSTKRPLSALERVQTIVGASPDDRTLRVYTRKGQRVDLPRGSTPVDFASVICSSWVSRLEGVTLNREWSHLLTPLKRGDVVGLQLSEEGSSPRPLPSGWKTRTSRAKRIAKQYRRAVRPHLEEIGRGWVVDQLSGAARQLAADERILSEAVQKSIDSICGDAERGPVMPRLPKGKRETVRWWYEQIGRLKLFSDPSSAVEPEGVACLDASDKSPLESQFPIAESPTAKVIHEVLPQLVSLVGSHLSAGDLHFRFDFDLPAELRNRISDYRLCERCTPLLTEPLLAEQAGGQTLVFHRQEAGCAGPEALRVVSKRRAPSKQFFVVEVSNGGTQAGAALAVLESFASRGITILDLAGHQVGQRWGVMRMEVGYVEREVVRAVRQELEGLPCVTRVYDPSHPPTPRLERFLPPRVAGTPLARSAGSPYVCGPELQDPSDFYGMDVGLHALNRAYEDIAVGGYSPSRTLFVHGPMRTGKSSLVSAFFRGIADPECISIKVQCGRGDEPWVDVRTRIWNRVRSVAVQRGLPMPGRPDEVSLLDLFDHIQHVARGPVLLAIDEVGALLSSMEGRSPHEPSRAALLELKSFARGFVRSAGRLLIWIGPDLVDSDPATRETADVLRHAHPVHPTPFTLEQTADALQARHKDSLYTIDLAEGVAERVFRLTSGNPYWTMCLGSAMWTESRRFTGAVFAGAAYDLQTLEVARGEVARESRYFTPLLPSPQGIAGSMVRALAQEGRLTRSQMLAVPGGPSSVQDRPRAVKRLLGLGAMRVVGTSPEPIYEMSAPILADHINDYYS